MVKPSLVQPRARNGTRLAVHCRTWDSLFRRAVLHLTLIMPKDLVMVLHRAAVRRGELRATVRKRALPKATEIYRNIALYEYCTTVGTIPPPAVVDRYRLNLFQRSVASYYYSSVAHCVHPTSAASYSVYKAGCE